MKKFFVCLLFFSHCFLQAQSLEHRHAVAERDFNPRYAKLATGDFTHRQTSPNRTRHPWPVQVKSIGHTMASYQSYSFAGAAYFHHGLDIRADAGSDVFASTGGKVINIENYMPGDPAYWEVAILDEEGFIWQYHHVDRESIPETIFQAYKNQTPIVAGTKLGEVFYWPVVTFGERFHHIHLNVLGKDKSYWNPFEFLQVLPDSSSPEIAHFHLLVNGKPVPGNTVSQSGYSVAAEIRDLILSDVFIVPANEIRVGIDGASPFTVWKFEGLPGGTDTEKFVNQFYVPSLACGDYRCRKPVIDLGFRLNSTQVFPVTAGSHFLDLTVIDYNGNSTSRRFTWTVK